MTWMDLRFAARTLAKQRGFTVMAVLTLALGIGAATSVFSIVDAVLLKPLPYKDPNRLTAVWLTSPREKGLAKIFAGYGDYVEFSRKSRTLERVSAATWASRRNNRVLTGRGPARDVFTIPATVEFFDTLGVAAEVGRTFRPDDISRGCSIVLSHGLWKSVLAGDPSVSGQALTLDQQACTIAGVMPESFSFYPRQAQAWILIGPGLQPNLDQMPVGIFARLKPGISVTQAEAELRTLYRELHPSGEVRDFRPIVNDLHGEFTFLAGRTLRTTLLLVFAAVLLVLFIACLNVANLFLARLSDRRRELAVRAALGSGQARLVRQLLTEGMLLSSLGLALGVVLAIAAIRYFRAVNPIELTVGADVALNLPVLLFSAAISMGATLLFGLLPAIRAARVDPIQYLKTGGRGSIQSRQRFTRLVIGCEVALSFVLLIGASLLMTSAFRMGSEPLGMDPSHVLTTRVTLPATRYSTDAGRTRFANQLLENLGHLPVSAAVALASRLPDSGGSSPLEVRNRPFDIASAAHDIMPSAVSPTFFDVLRIPMRRGRQFGPLDRENTLPVAIVNEALVRQYFPDTEPLGQQIRVPDDSMPWLTIVGVAGNVKHPELMNEMAWVESPMLYRPIAQDPRQSMTVAIRIFGDASALVKELPRRIAAMDPSIPVHDPETLATELARPLAYPRFRGAVLGFFALAALLLSAVGLHGVLSQIVTRRTAEFGLRRAVGAQTSDVLWLVARQGGGPVIAGLAAGLGLTLALSSFLGSLLYGTQAADPAILTAVSLSLLIVAALAIAVPASRAASVDPMTALRDE